MQINNLLIKHTQSYSEFSQQSKQKIDFDEHLKSEAELLQKAKEYQVPSGFGLFVEGKVNEQTCNMLMRAQTSASLDEAFKKYGFGGEALDHLGEIEAQRTHASSYDEFSKIIERNIASLKKIYALNKMNEPDALNKGVDILQSALKKV